jgi:hypothetical protein
MSDGGWPGLLVLGLWLIACGGSLDAPTADLDHEHDLMWRAHDDAFDALLRAHGGVDADQAAGLVLVAIAGPRAGRAAQMLALIRPTPLSALHRVAAESTHVDAWTVAASRLLDEGEELPERPEMREALDEPSSPAQVSLAARLVLRDGAPLGVGLDAIDPAVRLEAVQRLPRPVPSPILDDVVLALAGEQNLEAAAALVSLLADTPGPTARDAVVTRYETASEALRLRMVAASTEGAAPWTLDWHGTLVREQLLGWKSVLPQLPDAEGRSWCQGVRGEPEAISGVAGHLGWIERDAACRRAGW